MKVTDDKTRRKLAKRVAAGELTLAKLRRLTGTREPKEKAEPERPKRRGRTAAGVAVAARNTDDALMDLKGRMATVVDELADLLRQREVIDQIPATNRDNLAKYLTITKLKLENAIAIVRASREE
jgi:hypothetical protein